MVTRIELRKAVQLIGELRQKHPERRFWIEECSDAMSGGWTTSYWIFTKPFQKPTWYSKLLPRRGIGLKRIRE